MPWIQFTVHNPETQFIAITIDFDQLIKILEYITRQIGVTWIKDCSKTLFKFVSGVKTIQVCQCKRINPFLFE